jgi:hypothetical protein
MSGFSAIKHRRTDIRSCLNLIATDRDIVCKGLAQEGFEARRATARDVMTPGIHCCREDDDLAKAVRQRDSRSAGCR